MMNNKKYTYEEALEQLESLVKKLEEGNVSLEQSVKDFELATDLKRYCEQKLNEAQMSVEKIVKGDATQKEPFDVE